jgi:hypothetical protein
MEKAKCSNCGMFWIALPVGKELGFFLIPTNIIAFFIFTAVVGINWCIENLL